jgi:G:T/U-mismatch repair DNA glycosylase
MVRSTVCLEGYRISKDGRCIKDKAYKVVVTNVPTKAKKPRAPRAATVCLEGYKISKDGRCIKDKNYKVAVLPKKTRAPRAATVCFEGYKISKDGRCIKDKNYKVVVLPESHPTPVVTEPAELLQLEPNKEQELVLRKWM